MPPKTYEDWLPVARQRGVDAERVLDDSDPQAVCGPYLAGYAVECGLKAVLNAYGKSFSKRGAEGHNLKELLRAVKEALGWAGTPFSISGFFRDTWGTDLRYELRLDRGTDARTQVEQAQRAVGHMGQHIRKAKKAKGRRP